MRDQIFSILKCSYDRLSDDTLGICFLYCSIFPEDCRIDKNDLIELWIMEGFLNKFNDLSDARNEGEHIIRSLVLACLLESCASEVRVGDWEDYVRMHDVIRDMALWLASEHGKKNKIVVLENVELSETHTFAEWKETEILSLWRSSFEI